MAHQDVYLPRGWLDQARTRLDQFSVREPDWMVAGSYGVRADGRHVGLVWDAGLGRELGAGGFNRALVGWLDELLLFLPRNEFFRFDPDSPHFHLYGTDLVQSAIAKGRSAWPIELPLEISGTQY